MSVEATDPANGSHHRGDGYRARRTGRPARGRIRSADPGRRRGVSAAQDPRRAPGLSVGGAGAQGPRPRHPRSDHRSDGRGGRRRGAAFGAGTRHGGGRRRRAVAVRADPRRRRSCAGRHDGDDHLCPAVGRSSPPSPAGRGRAGATGATGGDPTRPPPDNRFVPKERILHPRLSSSRSPLTWMSR